MHQRGEGSQPVQDKMGWLRSNWSMHKPTPPGVLACIFNWLCLLHADVMCTHTTTTTTTITTTTTTTIPQPRQQQLKTQRDLDLIRRLAVVGAKAVLTVSVVLLVWTCTTEVNRAYQGREAI